MLKRLVSLVIPLFSVSLALAQSVTYVGSNIDLGAGWRTPSVPKTDIDGDGVLGTDGWIVVGAQGSTFLPSYLTGVYLNSSIYAGNPSYYSIDNPATTPGATPSTVVTGTWNPAVAPDSPITLASFTLGGAIPNTIQIGLMIDNLDQNYLNPPTLGVFQTDGTASATVDTSGIQYRDGVPDWVYFDITGVAGNQFAIQTYGNAAGGGILSAISFDSAPEPSSLLLFGLGMAGIGVAAIRHRRQV
jgi:hypothetical protein